MAKPDIENESFHDVYLGERFTREGTGSQPVPADMPEVKGIFVGGCVKEGVGKSLQRKSTEPVGAHAHVAKTDSHRGWICFAVPRYFHDPDNKPLLMHEYAHILTGEGHTGRWRQAMRRLGQPIPERYSHRPRRRHSQ